MGLRDFVRKRRQRKARKRYEREKALRELQNDEKAWQRVENFRRDLMGDGGGD